MKKSILIIAVAFIASQFMLNAQNATVPSIDLYTLDGNKINSSEILNGQQPTILIFWKTNDKDCCNQISSMIEAHKEILEDDNVRLVCVCIDCIGKTSHIKPFVYGRNWEVEVYIDKNGDFKRAMNIADTPLTIVYNTDRKVVCNYLGYCAGTEEMLCEKLKHCLVLK